MARMPALCLAKTLQETVVFDQTRAAEPPIHASRADTECAKAHFQNHKQAYRIVIGRRIRRCR
jgi:hypothetical protein